jgi:hypothetical protein
MGRKAARRVALVGAVAALAGCFDPPVVERLELSFLADGSYVVQSTVEINELGMSGNPALERRLDELRRALEGGWDDWARRFDALGAPPAERAEVEKLDGRLRRSARAAYLATPAALGGFFADTTIQAGYEVRDDRAELTLSPGAAARATRRQRQQVERALGQWSVTVADYLAAVGGLYAYLERRPERATASLGALFSDLLDEARAGALPEPSDEETALVERLSDAMSEVVDVLQVARGEAHSLDELSRLVYDPFPASLSVTLPSPPLELEGFVPASDGPLRVPGLSLWEALRALEGRWVSPDPAAVYVAQRAGPGGAGRFDLEGFVARARRAADPPPTGAEVAQALRQRLQPAPLYRAVWKVDPDAEVEPPW